jgi:F1F0 ATPase subunit 2
MLQRVVLDSTGIESRLVTTPTTAILLGTALGVATAAGYVGLLWWNVSRLAEAPHPTVELLVGMALRFVLVIAGFGLALSRGGAALAAAMIVFWVGRTAATWWVGPGDETIDIVEPTPGKET